MPRFPRAESHASDAVRTRGLTALTCIEAVSLQCATLELHFDPTVLALKTDRPPRLGRHFLRNADGSGSSDDFFRRVASPDHERQLLLRDLLFFDGSPPGVFVWVMNGEQRRPTALDEQGQLASLWGGTEKRVAS